MLFEGSTESVVEIRMTPEYGPGALGAFATAAISAGAYLGDYKGELIDSDQLISRYPDMEPEFCFRVGEETYVDARNASHWTKRMNHDARDPSVIFEVDEARRAVSFFAARAISPGEELRFDYGREFWDGRSISPLNDDRVYNAPAPACDMLDLGVPLSRGALRDVLRARASREEKRAALGRGLEYFGAIDVTGTSRVVRDVPPLLFASLRRRRRTKKGSVSSRDIPYDQATLGQLARALRRRISDADNVPDDDDDHDDDDDGLFVVDDDEDQEASKFSSR